LRKKLPQGGVGKETKTQTGKGKRLELGVVQLVAGRAGNFTGNWGKPAVQTLSTMNEYGPIRKLETGRGRVKRCDKNGTIG